MCLAAGHNMKPVGFEHRTFLTLPLGHHTTKTLNFNQLQFITNSLNFMLKSSISRQGKLTTHFVG